MTDSENPGPDASQGRSGLRSIPQTRYRGRYPAKILDRAFSQLSRLLTNWGTSSRSFRPSQFMSAAGPKFGLNPVT